MKSSNVPMSAVMAMIVACPSHTVNKLSLRADVHSVRGGLLVSQGAWGRGTSLPAGRSTGTGDRGSQVVYAGGPRLDSFLL